MSAGQCVVMNAMIENPTVFGGRIFPRGAAKPRSQATGLADLDG